MRERVGQPKSTHDVGSFISFDHHQAMDDNINDNANDDDSLSDSASFDDSDQLEDDRDDLSDDQQAKSDHEEGTASFSYTV